MIYDRVNTGRCIKSDTGSLAPPAQENPGRCIKSDTGSLAPPLRKIRNELPDTINAAIIVVQHLSNEHPSKLDDILQAATTLPVTKVYENTRIERGNVYVIAEGEIMQ